MITILHISDLHFGPKFRFNDSKYKSIPEDDRPKLAKQLSEDIVTKLKKKIDIVIVSGDLTWTADAIQFEWCRKFLSDLSRQLDVPCENFVIVPGNHDIPWPGTKKEREKANRADLFLVFRRFFKDFFDKNPTSLLYQVFCNEEVSLLGLNSALLEEKTNAGIGYVGTTQFKRAIKVMQKEENYKPEAIKIAVLHHHLVPVVYLDIPDKKTHSFSITRDAGKIIEALMHNGFQIVLHGHQHQPFIGSEIRMSKGSTNEESLTEKDKLWVFGAGSIGVSRESLGEIGKNQYFLLEINPPRVKITSRITHFQDESEFMDHHSIQIELGQ